MSMLNWAIDMGQSADIDRLNHKLEESQKDIEDIKKILHHMALRIVELEKKIDETIPNNTTSKHDASNMQSGLSYGEGLEDSGK